MVDHNKPSNKMRIFEVLSQVVLRVKKIDKLKFVYVCLCLTFVASTVSATYAIRHSANNGSFRVAIKWLNHSSVKGIEKNASDTDATIADKNVSGVFRAGENEKEVIEKREENFKTFDQGGGKFRVAGSTGPIHYKLDPTNKSEEYKEINLTIKEHFKTKTDSWDYAVEDNGYQVRLWNNRQVNGELINYVAQFRKAGKFIEMAPSELVWENANGDRQIISTPIAVGKPLIDNTNYTITWKNVFGEGIDFRYNIAPDKFFKTVIVNSKENLPLPKIDEQGLKLTVVMKLSWDESVSASNDFAEDVKIQDLNASTETESLEKPNSFQPELNIASEPSIESTVSAIVRSNLEIEKIVEKEKLSDPTEKIVSSAPVAFDDDLARDVWWMGSPIAWDSSEGKKTFNLSQQFIRVDDRVFNNLSLDKKDIDSLETKFPLYIDTNITQQQVATSLNDVRRCYLSDIWSTNDWLIWGSSGAGNQKESSGIRFPTVPIAQNANVYNAYLSFVPSGAISADTTTKTKIRAQAADSPGVFSTQADWDTRFPGALTTASVNWDSTPAVAATTFYPTPNIATVVQELVNRAGWVSNNSMVFFVDDYDARSTVGSRKISYSYDNSSTYAPTLNISYYTPGTLNISGTCKQLNRSTNCADSVVIKAAINGVLQGTTGSTLSGVWSINGLSANSGDVITIFKDNVADANEAVSVIKLGTGDLSDVALYERHLTIGATLGGTVTNNDIGRYDNSVSADEDIFVEVDASDNLTVPAAGTSDSTVNQIIYPLNTNTWQPKSAGGTTTIVPVLYIPSGGTITLDSNTVNLTGTSSVITNSGTLNVNTSTINFIETTGNLTLPIGTYYNLGVGTTTDSTTGRTYTLGTGTTTVNNQLTVGNATSTNNDTFAVSTQTLVLAGSGTSIWNVTTKGTVTNGNSTITYLGSSATTVRGMTYYNLNLGTTADTGTGVTYTMGAASTIANLATVGNASSTNTDTLALSSYKMTITKTAAYPFTVTTKGAIDAGTSEVEYYADGNQNISPATTITYYNLTIDSVLTADRTLTTNGAITVTNNMTMYPYGASNPRTQTLTLAGALSVTGTLRVEGSGTGRPILNTSTSNYAVTAGVLNLATGGNIFANNSTVTINGNATVVGIYAGMVNSNLSVAGNIIVSGTMSTIGTVTLAKQNDASATITSGGSKFPNLVINASGSTYTLQDNLNVYGNLTITAGTLDASASGNRMIKLTGMWTNNGTFTARAGTVQYIDYESGKTINSNGQSFNNLTINGGSNDYTKSLFHFDGANGSTTITDEQDSGWTVAGAAQLATGQKKFGTASLSCDGSTSWLTRSTNVSNYQIGSNDDFTIDTWVYLNEAAGAATRMIAEEGNGAGSWSTSNGHHWALFTHTDSKVYFQYNNAGAAASLTSSTNIVTTTWTHITIVRGGGFIKMYINGTERATAVTPAFISLPNGGTAYMNVCSSSDHTATQVWKGYIDEFRFQKGVGRWGAAFTSPAAAYSTDQSLSADATISNTFTMTKGTFVSGSNNLVLKDYTQTAGSFTAPAAGKTFSISGNLTNAAGGTLLDNSGTLTLNGATLQTITAGGTDASHDFSSITVTNASANGVSFADSLTLTGTFTDTTASSKLSFNTGSTYTFANISINGGAVGTRITMTGAGTWNFIVAQATPVASYVHVTNSNATGSAAQINATTGSYDNGGNTYWDFGAPAVTVTVSGTIYTAENKSTNIGPNKTIALSINGTAATTVETTDGGVFTFSSQTVSTNQTVAIFISGETEKGSLITQAADNSTNITGLELYTGHIVLTHNTAGPMTNTLLATVDNVANSDLLISVDGSNVATFTSGDTVWILAGKTYTPGANVSLGSLNILSTGSFTPEGNTTTINDSGTPFMVGGTFNEGTSTVVYAGASPTNVTGSTYKNLTINHAAVTFTQAGSATVSGVFTIQAGIFDASSQLLYLSGTTGTPFVNSGTFTSSTSTVYYTGNNGGGNTNVTATTYNNLYLNNGSETYAAAGNIGVGGVLTINAGTFSAADKAITLSGSGTPFVITGTFLEGTSTIEYTGGSATNVTASTYSNLKLNHTGTTFSATGSTTVSGVFTIQAGVFDGSDKTIILSGNGTPFVVSGTFAPSTSTVRYTGDSSTTVAAVNYWNLETKTASATSVGKGIDLAGSTSKVGASTNSALNISTNLTIELWLQLDSDNQHAGLIFKGSSATQGEYSLLLYNNYVYFRLNGSVSGPGELISTSTLTGTGLHHLAATYDGSYQRIWLDGTKIGEAAYSTAITNTNVGMWVGSYFDGNYGLNGKIYSTRISNTVRYSTAFSPIKGWFDDQNTSLLWNYEEGTGTNINDDSSNNIDGTVIGSYSWANQPDSGVLTPVYTISGGTLDVGGSYTNGDGTNEILVQASTNDPTFNVNGNFANAAKATFIASDSASLSVASDFSLNASSTFTHSSGGITLDGQGLQTVTMNGTVAGHNFNNLTITNADSTNGIVFADSITIIGTFTDVTATSKITFHSGSTYAFNAINIDGQSTGTRITLTSSTGGSAWNLNIAASSPTASNVWVKDSNANKDVDATTGGYDGTGNTHWLFPAGNSVPTNDSLAFTNPYSSNVVVADDTTEWNFRALVTDSNGSTDLSYVELRLANATDSTQPYDSLKFRWTEATDTFSEEADTQNAATLTSTSANSTANGNQWTLDFKVKINSSFTSTSTNYAAELYSLDDAAAADTDNYSNIYQVNGLSLSASVNNASIAFGQLLPGSVLTGTTDITVTTNYPNGYSISASDSVTGSNSALLNTDNTTRVSDYTGTIATPTIWSSGTGFGICLYVATGKNTSKWGTGTTETDVNNKYAGVPETATQIHQKTGSPTSSDLTEVGYKLVVPNTQKTGDYAGVITYTVTGALN